MTFAYVRLTPRLIWVTSGPKLVTPPFRANG